MLFLHNKLGISKQDDNSEKEILFENLKKIFDPRITKPYENHSKVVRVQDKYLAVDIFFLNTKTFVG